MLYYVSNLYVKGVNLCFFIHLYVKYLGKNKFIKCIIKWIYTKYFYNKNLNKLIVWHKAYLQPVKRISFSKHSIL